MTLTHTARQEMTDTEVRQLVVAGERAGLDEAYRAHAAVVFSLARKLTHNQALAEEVTQEVFLRLWKHPERFDPSRGSLRTWLLSQTHGRSIDLIRSESSRRIREERDHLLDLDTTPTIEEIALESERSREVRKAMQKLDPSERAAIEAAYFGGHSYRKVAELLGDPEGTVKSRIRSGMRKLAEALDEYR